jgi:hypothetical protein
LTDWLCALQIAQGKDGDTAYPVQETTTFVLGYDNSPFVEWSGSSLSGRKRLFRFGFIFQNSC